MGSRDIILVVSDWRHANAARVPGAAVAAIAVDVDVVLTEVRTIAPQRQPPPTSGVQHQHPRLLQHCGVVVPGSVDAAAVIVARTEPKVAELFVQATPP